MFASILTKLKLHLDEKSSLFDNNKPVKHKSHKLF